MWPASPPIANGNTADATQLMANLNYAYSCLAPLTNPTFSGSVGIGAAGSPISGYGHVVTNGTYGALLSLTSSGAEQFRIQADSSENMLYGFTNLPLLFIVNSIESMVLEPTHGWVGIGTSSPADALDTGGGVVRTNGIRTRQGTGGSAGSNAFNIFWSGSGAQLWIDTTNVGTISTVSDRRLKQQVETMADNGLSRLMKLRPVTFHWRDSGMFRDDKVLHQGFIADEVQTVIPSAVNNKKNEVDAKGRPVYQSLVPTEIIPVLTKAIQEQQGEIENLKTTLDEKEAEIRALKSEQQAQIDDLRALVAGLVHSKVVSLR
jgi:hypothetical protein